MTAIPHSVAHAGPAAKSPGFFSRYQREISVAVAYVLLLLLLGVIRPAFFQPQAQSQAASLSQFQLTWISAAPVLVAAIGMTLVILARQIDISIGSQFSVCGVVAGLLAAGHMPMPAVVLGVLLAGALMGALNGALIAGMGMPSIVVTLATMVIIRGTLMLARQGAAVYAPASFQWFGASQQVGRGLIVAIALLVFVIFAIGMRWFAGGRAVFAVGSDREAARLAGIRPDRVVFLVFVLMGALTGLGALLQVSQFPVIQSNSGKDMELAVIAAVVVGGTAVSGGRGTLAGTFIGVLLLSTIGPALIYFHARYKWIGPEWARAVQGSIILLAVATDGLRRRAG